MSNVRVDFTYYCTAKLEVKLEIWVQYAGFGRFRRTGRRNGVWSRHSSCMHVIAGVNNGVENNLHAGIGNTEWHRSTHDCFRFRGKEQVSIGTSI
jgi:hypothetical protein